MSDRQCPRCSSGTMRAYGVPTVDADGDETVRLRCSGCGASTFEVRATARKRRLWERGSIGHRTRTGAKRLGSDEADDCRLFMADHSASRSAPPLDQLDASGAELDAVAERVGMRRAYVANGWVWDGCSLVLSGTPGCRHETDEEFRARLKAERRRRQDLVPGLPGLAAWYRADLVVESGDAVSQWTDRSGNGYHLTQAERRDRAVQIWCRHYAETEAFDRRLFHRVGPDGCAVPIEPDDRISSSKNAGRSSEKARDDCRALGLSWSQINEARNLAGSMSIDEASRIAGVSLPPLGGCE